MSAMWPFNFEKGIATSSWYAELALRMRVSMSAMGSVMDTVVSPFSSRFRSLVRAPGLERSGQFFVDASDYQDDLVTPGSSPAWAISRRQIRHRPNLR